MDNGEATPHYITQFTRFKISLTLVEPNQLSLRICLSDSHQKCQQWVGSGRFHLGFETWIWFSTSWHGFSSGRLLEHRDSGGESSAVESHLSFIVGPYFQSRNVVWGTFFFEAEMVVVLLITFSWWSLSLLSVLTHDVVSPSLPSLCALLLKHGSRTSQQQKHTKTKFDFRVAFRHRGRRHGCHGQGQFEHLQRPAWRAFNHQRWPWGWEDDPMVRVNIWYDNRMTIPWEKLVVVIYICIYIYLYNIHYICWVIVYWITQPKKARSQIKKSVSNSIVTSMVMFGILSDIPAYWLIPIWSHFRDKIMSGVSNVSFKMLSVFVRWWYVVIIFFLRHPFFHDCFVDYIYYQIHV